MFHILNGDSPAGTFRQSNIKEPMIPWYEILMEGPVSDYKDSELFWKKRIDFLVKTFKVDLDEYKRDPLDLMTIHSNLNPDEEIVLWFDTDLFCQINLMYIIHWFHENTKRKLFLVCPQNDSSYKDTFRLGMSPPENYTKLLEQKRELSQDEKEFSSRAWKAYASPNPQDLVDLLHNNNCPLPHLQKALALHLLRYPSTTNGLNLIQIKILALNLQKAP